MTGRRPWQPVETADELEARLAYVTPRRARQIRAELEAEQPPPPPILEAGRCTACGRTTDARCPLPTRHCPLKRSSRPT